jgi:hypothetical protein
MYQIKSTHMVYFLKTTKIHLQGKIYTTFIGVNRSVVLRLAVDSVVRRYSRFEVTWHVSGSQQGKQ